MNKEKFKIAIATGGTGGHIFPALATADELHSRGHECLVLADRRFLNYKTQIPNYLDYKIIPSGSFAGGMFRKLTALAKISLGIIFAIKIYLKHKPNLVIGFGGYTSFPSVIAAKILRIPVFIHEQNAVIGKTNSFLIKLANVAMVTFDETVGIDTASNHVELVGNPVRKQVLLYRNSSYKAPTLKSKINILVTGGSQGARIFSKIIPKAISTLDVKTRDRICLVQQCRIEDLMEVRQQYNEIGIEAVVEKFFDNMPKLLAEAHIIISRAGASTISELIAIGRPAILIPIERSIGNHQYLNAKKLVDHDAAWIINEPEFTVEKCVDLLTNLLLTQPKKLSDAASNVKSLYNDASDRLVDMIINFCRYGHI